MALARLEQQGLLDNSVRSDLDRLTEFAADITGCPFAMATVIDVERERQILVSTVGLPLTHREMQEIPLSQSVCHAAARAGGVVAVGDVRTDPALRDSPIAGWFGVRAYLGVPISDLDDHVFGTLCLIDDQPRDWSEQDIDRATTLGAAVASVMRQRMARRRAEAGEEALEDLNRRFRDLAANVPGAIFRYSETSDGKSSVEYMSPGCLDIWEIPPEAVHEDASPLWNMILPEDLDAMVASVRRSADRLERWQHRFRIQTPSGRLKWLEGHGRPIAGPNGSTVWNSLVLDVTTEVEAELRARDGERLLMEASKQEGIGRLAGGIAHDFNNLLSIAMGSAELMRDAPDDAARHELIQAILGACERGGELTRRLLSFARQSTLTPAVFDPREVVQTMTGLIRRAVAENIAIELTLGGSGWPIRADRNYFENAIVNLCVNARDAMPDGGVLRIAVDTVTLDAAQITGLKTVALTPGRYVVVTVTDTGAGIDPNALETVFEPFFSTKPAAEGSGLGLSMVRGFAEQSGGAITVASEPGQGARFRLYFPASDHAASAPAVMRHPDLAVPENLSVLWVEDEAPLRRVVKTMLEISGISVVDAASGDEAWAIFERDPDRFDLIISDVVMPGDRSGTDLVSDIRALGHDTPAIFVSGYPRDEMIQTNKIAACDQMLTKPLRRDSLLRAIGKAVEATVQDQAGQSSAPSQS